MKNARKRTRRKFTGDFKAKVAVEALKAQETVSQIAARHELHPHQVAQWKKQLQQAARNIFEAGTPSGAGAVASHEMELYEDRASENGAGVAKKSLECLSLESRRGLTEGRAVLDSAPMRAAGAGSFGALSRASAREPGEPEAHAPVGPGVHAPSGLSSSPHEAFPARARPSSERQAGAAALALDGAETVFPKPIPFH